MCVFESNFSPWAKYQAGWVSCMCVSAGTGNLQLHPLQRHQPFYQECSCSTGTKPDCEQVLEVAGLTAAVYVQPA